MEGNKDEADRCIDLAQQAFNAGDRAKAHRLLTKADKLFPSERAQDLLTLLNKLGESQSTANTANGTRRRNLSSGRRDSDDGSNKNSESKSCGAEYTEEQVIAVKKIKSSKDYYEILNVKKDSTDTDLKKSYRKLALQFHPDKNKAPGAGEAFKAIGNAFAILSDPEKRKKYDMYGSDIANNSSYNRSNYEQSNGGYTRGFESDMTAEELFNMFFGSTFPSSSGVYRRGGNGGRGRTTYYYSSNNSQGSTGDSTSEGQGNNASVALQLLPVLFFILVTLLSSFFVSDPAYSLTRSQKYNVKRVTNDLDVPYYVKESFTSDFQGNVKRLEAGIEEEFVSITRNDCFKQRNYKDHMIWRARNFGDEEMLRQAKEMALPSCDAMHQLRQKSRYG